MISKRENITSGMGHKYSSEAQVIFFVFRMVYVRDKFKLTGPFHG